MWLCACGWWDGSHASPSRFHPSSFKKELNKKRYLKPADFADAPVDDLPTLELEQGAGSRAAARGDTVTVHFDVLYRGIDVASTRSARLLGANRSLPEPFTFKVGGPVTAAAAKAAGVEGGGGLFTGASGPTPPAALSTAVLGMRVGGKRALLVPPARGYGEGKGIGEAPPGADVELRVEVLAIE